MQFFGGGHKFVTDADHIPGRNYLSGTTPVSVQGQNIVAQVIATYALTDKSLSNQVVTFNMTITSDTTSGRLYVGSSPNWQAYTYSDIQKGINKIQFTIKLNSDVDAIKLSLDNSTANLVIQDATLNKGNFAREYSPAPEDYAMKSDYDELLDHELGIGNLLTDDEMNIANALKSTAAQGAISNMNYSNGVSRFHYKGTVGYEVIDWPFKVSPNTSYRMEIVVNSTNEMTALSNDRSYMLWGINSQEDLNDNVSGDIGNWQLPLPWSKETSGSIIFNSGSYSKLYLITNFGLAKDGIDTDITLQIKLLRNDSIQAQIYQLRSQIEQLKQK